MTEPTAPPADAPASTSSPSASGWLDRASFPIVRRVLATLGVLAAAGTYAYHEWPFELVGWIEAVVIGSTVLGLHTRRVELHVLARAAWWGLLVVGAVAAVSAAPGIRPWVVMGGAALALIATGRAGLEPGTGRFRPRAMPRALVGMMVVGASVAHVLVLEAAQGARFFELGIAALLAVSVVGIGRTRSWGLFAYLGAILATLGAAAWVHSFGPTSEFVDLRGLLMLIHLIVAGILTVAVAPILGALVVRPKARDSFGKGWGHWAHAALVLGLIGAVAAYRLFAPTCLG